MKAIYIYCLVNPLNNKPFYVGASINPKARLNEHSQECYDGSNPANGRFKFEIIKNRKGPIIYKIKQAGKKIKLKILKKCTIKTVDYWEKYYFDLFTSQKIKLCQSPHGFNYSKRHPNITKPCSH